MSLTYHHKKKKKIQLKLKTSVPKNKYKFICVFVLHQIFQMQPWLESKKKHLLIFGIISGFSAFLLCKKNNLIFFSLFLKNSVSNSCSFFLFLKKLLIFDVFLFIVECKKIFFLNNANNCSSKNI